MSCTWRLVAKSNVNPFPGRKLPAFGTDRYAVGVHCERRQVGKRSSTTRQRKMMNFGRTVAAFVENLEVGWVREQAHKQGSQVCQ